MGAVSSLPRLDPFSAADSGGVDLALNAFLESHKGLPVEAMQWCLDHWDVAGPELVRYFDLTTQGDLDDDEDIWALLIIFHLFGEKCERSAFGPICRLLLNKERTELAIDWAVTMTLRRVLISTFDGDLSQLTQVIEAPGADEFARSAALKALTYLFATGRLPGFDMRRYLYRLLTESDPEDGCYL